MVEKQASENEPCVVPAGHFADLKHISFFERKARDAHVDDPHQIGPAVAAISTPAFRSFVAVGETCDR